MVKFNFVKKKCVATSLALLFISCNLSNTGKENNINVENNNQKEINNLLILNCEQFEDTLSKLNICDKLNYLLEINSNAHLCLGNIVVKIAVETKISSHLVSSYEGLYYENYNLFKKDIEKWKSYYGCDGSVSMKLIEEK